MSNVRDARTLRKKRDATPQLKKIDLDKFPIKLPEKKGLERFLTLFEQITTVSRKIYDLKISGSEKELLEQQIKNLDYEINQEVYKLYAITKEEQKMNEDSLI